MRKSSALPVALAAALVFATAACSTDKDRLAGACQMQRCVCAGSGWSSVAAGGGSPVIWRSDGSASCPEGLELHLLKPPPGRVQKSTL